MAVPACKNELIALPIADTAGPVQSVDRRGSDVIVKLAWMRWLKTVRPLQLKIGMSAWCMASHDGGSGNVLITDEDDIELARVEGGKWMSKLVPE